MLALFFMLSVFIAVYLPHIFPSSNHPGSFPLLSLFPSLFDIRMAEDEECVGGIHSEFKKRARKKRE